MNVRNPTSTHVWVKKVSGLLGFRRKYNYSVNAVVFLNNTVFGWFIHSCMQNGKGVDLPGGASS